MNLGDFNYRHDSFGLKTNTWIILQIVKNSKLERVVFAQLTIALSSEI